MKIVGVVFAALLVLTGCGGSTPSYSSAQAAATKLGCSNYQDEATDDLQYFVTAAGTCTFKGTDVTINWYDSKSAKKQYVEVADYFGGGMLVGDNWTIDCTSKTTCQTIAKALGGEVKFK